MWTLSQDKTNLLLFWGAMCCMHAVNWPPSTTKPGQQTMSVSRAEPPIHIWNVKNKNTFFQINILNDLIQVCNLAFLHSSHWHSCIHPTNPSLSLTTPMNTSISLIIPTNPSLSLSIPTNPSFSFTIPQTLHFHSPYPQTVHSHLLSHKSFTLTYHTYKPFTLSLTYHTSFPKPSHTYK